MVGVKSDYGKLNEPPYTNGEALTNTYKDINIMSKPVRTVWGVLRWDYSSPASHSIMGWVLFNFFLIIRVLFQNSHM